MVGLYEHSVLRNIVQADGEDRRKKLKKSEECVILKCHYIRFS